MQEKYNVTGMTSENLLVYKTGIWLFRCNNTYPMIFCI